MVCDMWKYQLMLWWLIIPSFSEAQIIQYFPWLILLNSCSVIFTETETQVEKQLQAYRWTSPLEDARPPRLVFWCPARSHEMEALYQEGDVPAKSRAPHTARLCKLGRGSSCKSHKGNFDSNLHFFRLQGRTIHTLTWLCRLGKYISLQASI